MSVSANYKVPSRLHAFCGNTRVVGKYLACVVCV